MARKEYVKLSKYVRNSLHIHPKIKITKEDLIDICQTAMEEAEDLEPNIGFVINATDEDIPLLMPYLNSNVIEIRVEYKKQIFDKDFLEYLKIQKKPVVTLENLKKFNKEIQESGKKIYIDLKQNQFENMTDNELEKIIQEYNIESICIDMENILNLDTNRVRKIPNVKLYYKDINSYEKDIDTVEKIKAKIERIISDINTDDKEINKFLSVYSKLLKKEQYDHSVCKILDREEKGDKLNEYEGKKARDSQNLSMLVTGFGVCGGYARSLQCILECIGIECKFIAGRTEPESLSSHAWNQVKIDGKWYNVDITSDAANYKDGIELEYCLKSDNDFKNYYPIFGTYKECKRNYNKNIIRETIKKKRGYDSLWTSVERFKPWELMYYDEENTIEVPKRSIQRNTEEIER